MREKKNAIAGGVDWDDIIAFRPMVNSRLASHIFFRQGNPWAQRDRVEQVRALSALAHVEHFGFAFDDFM